MTTRPKILIYDSGVGSLSIAREVLREIPACRLVCAADNAFFPYGTKDDAHLSKRIVEQVGRFHSLTEPDIVVVACNTASTLALATLRARFSTPFVGVVPAIKPASQRTKTGVIGVIATSATIRRPYTQKLIDEFAGGHRVILHAADALVALAEAKVRGKASQSDYISETLKSLVRDGANKIDTLVLACTHFPLLREELIQGFQAYHQEVEILDSGAAIANRVKHLLQDRFDINENVKVDISTLFSDSAAEPDLSRHYQNYLLSQS